MSNILIKNIDESIHKVGEGLTQNIEKTKFTKDKIEHAMLLNEQASLLQKLLEIKYKSQILSTTDFTKTTHEGY